MLSTAAKNNRNGIVEECENTGLLNTTIDNVLPINPNTMNTVSRMNLKRKMKRFVHYELRIIMDRYVSDTSVLNTQRHLTNKKAMGLVAQLSAG